MKRLIFFALALFFSAGLAAQDRIIPRNPNQADLSGRRYGKWTVLSDINGRTVSDAGRAAFYRLQTYRFGRPVGIARTFYMNGQLYSEGHIASENPIVYKGSELRYSNSGSPLSEIVYNGKRRLFSETLAAQKRVVRKNEDTYGKKAAEYLESAEILADLYYEGGFFREAEPVYIETAQAVSDLQGKRSPVLARLLERIGDLAELSGNNDRAENMYEQAAQIYGGSEELAGKAVKSFLRLGSFYRQNEKNTQAAAAFDAASKLQEMYLGKYHADYALSLKEKADLFADAGRTEPAEKLLLEAAKIEKEVLGDMSLEYAMTLGQTARLYEQVDQTARAENFYRESIRILEHLPRTDFLQALYNSRLADICFRDKRNNDAEYFYHHALASAENGLSRSHPVYLASARRLGAFYRLTGQPAEAEVILAQAAAELEVHNFVSDTLYAGIMWDLAGLYADSRSNERADPFFREIVDMSPVLGAEHPYVKGALAALTKKLDDQGLEDHADAIVRKTLIEAPLPAEAAEPEDRRSAREILTLAQNYSRSSLYDRAEKMLLRISRRDDITDAEDGKVYLEALTELAKVYRQTERPELAEEIYSRMLALSEIRFGKNHTSYPAGLLRLAEVYHARYDYENAVSLYKKSGDAYLSLANKHLPMLSAQEKSTFYADIHRAFESFYSFALLSGTDNPELIGRAYDRRLEEHSFLFNHEGRLESRILNSGDAGLIGRFDRWKNDRRRQADLITASSAEGLYTENSEPETGEDELRNEFLRIVSLNERSISGIGWEQIRAGLRHDEAAVEIIRFRKFGAMPAESDSSLTPPVTYHAQGMTDQVCYAALIVTAGTEHHPRLVIFENGNELEGQYWDDYSKSLRFRREDRRSYDLYWKPIRDAVLSLGNSAENRAIKQVYISGDGVFNRMNLQTLVNPLGKAFAGDEMAINFLPDTRMLAQRQGPKAFPNEVILMGNPDFEANTERRTNALRTAKLSDFSPGPEGGYESVPGQIAALPASAREILAFKQQLEGNGKSVESYLGQFALEEQVKALTGPGVLHLASRVYYNEDTDGPRNPLLRTGILLAGAAQSVGGESPENLQNGILTAEEIMNLNLDRTELVVLSHYEADESRHISESVQTLRNALHAAGAQAVLINLNQEDDRITQEFLREFYAAWAETADRTLAFSRAQAKLKAKYHHPSVWGSFVLSEQP